MIDVEQMTSAELRVVHHALRLHPVYEDSPVTLDDQAIADRLANLVWAEHCRRVEAKLEEEA